MKKALLCVLLGAFIALCQVSTAGNKKGGTLKPTIPDEHARVIEQTFAPAPQQQIPARTLSVGTYTSLSGYYDYQANGTPQHIRVNPANGNIHVTYMLADDSASVSPSRRTAYAFSTNAGSTWNNFSNVRVPSRRSGFPSIDLLQAPNAGSPVIGNHSTITGTQSAAFVDSPEGTGAFSELNAPPLIDAGATDEPIWPFVAGAADGSLIMHSSRSVAGTNHLNRTTDFSTWLYPTPWFTFSGPNGSGGRNSTQATTTGRVGTLVNAVSSGLYLYESTNNGATWSAPVTVHPALTVDSFSVWVSVDMAYDGNTPIVALNTSTTDGAGGYFYADAKIDFWSQATGLVTAVPHDTSLFVDDMNGFGQSNHLTLGGPTICKTGTQIVIVFQAFQRDTATSGHRYSDVWYVRSANNGATWTRPINITNTRDVDERYPSVSKWNQAGFVNMTWQEDVYPGTWVIATPDAGALPSRAKQVFYKLQVPTTGVDERGTVATGFKLEQNYPNPFNPKTRISYVVPTAMDVQLSVYNVLGQKVANVVDEYREAGNYEIDFNASHLSSGVYYYTLRAGTFSETKRMVLMK